MYFQNLGFVRQTYRALRKCYVLYNRPSDQFIHRTYDKFRPIFALLHGVSRHRSVSTKENIAAVSAAVDENLNLSIHRRYQQLGLFASTTWKILQKNLSIRPYKIQLTDVNEESVELGTKTRASKASKVTKATNKLSKDNLEEEEDQPKKITRVARNKVEAPSKSETKTNRKGLKENGAVKSDENGADENQGKETRRNAKRKVAEKPPALPEKKNKIVKGDSKKDGKKTKDTTLVKEKTTAAIKDVKPAPNQTSTKWDTIDFGNSNENANGKRNNFKITSWNVDGIRAWLKKGCLDIFEYDDPDILCLQETKCSEGKLPEEVADIKSYYSYWCSSEKEGYAGVGVYTKIEPISVVKGIGDEEHDNEGRCLTLEYDKFFLVNVYVPNAGRGLVTLSKRLNFNESFKAYIKKLDKKKPVIVCGDMNVAHNEIDLKNPKTNKKNAGFTQEERDGMTDFLSDGYIDSLREFYPDQENIYTFWSYMSNARAKNVGWRIDYFIYSQRIKDLICDSVVRSEVYGSDHCPISLFIHI